MLRKALPLLPAERSALKRMRTLIELGGSLLGIRSRTQLHFTWRSRCHLPRSRTERLEGEGDFS